MCGQCPRAGQGGHCRTRCSGRPGGGSGLAHGRVLLFWNGVHWHSGVWEACIIVPAHTTPAPSQHDQPLAFMSNNIHPKFSKDKKKELQGDVQSSAALAASELTDAAGESICTATPIPHAGQPGPQQGTRSLKLPIRDSRAGTWGWAERRSQSAVSSAGGGTHSPTLAALLVLHGPTGTPPAQAPPWLLPAGTRAVPTLGDPQHSSWWRARQIPHQNSPKQSPVPGHRGCHSVPVTP